MPNKISTIHLSHAFGNCFFCPLIFPTLMSPLTLFADPVTSPLILISPEVLDALFESPIQAEILVVKILVAKILVSQVQLVVMLK